MNHTSITQTGVSRHHSQRSYLIGFIFSIILTIIPFFLVIQQSTINHKILVVILVVCATIQILVHLTYFLHLDTSFQQNWDLMAFLFTVLIVLILVIGSLWIMWHLHINLMSC
ncbi:cytochrome o ubiquinol oxidase subunit IV [Candidatus Curculioniphilus buchneri]|uniref:cytochrome o ubiquinol oxidase subunit IV n=1 Tax=Candidatus Curculioniphilus buchneri TaxID=690594 RepID=UPI00376F4534